MLDAVRAHLVSALATANLVLAVQCASGMVSRSEMLAHPFFEYCTRLAPVCMLTPGGGFRLQASGPVGQDNARLGLVAMLPTRPSVALKAHVDVTLVECTPRLVKRLQHRHSDG